MADNGRNFNGTCLPDSQYALNFCLRQYPTHTNHIGAFWSDGTIQCRLKNPEIYPSHVSKAPDCELPGSSLTEIQQIEAINAMFPAAVAILATAWAFKWLRNMVYEWLKERNQND